jgi:hypothetical protein
MKTKLPYLLATALLVAWALPAVADTSGPMGGLVPVFPPYFEDAKSPPLRNSDTFATQWGMHITSAFGNYAGFLFDLQYDGNEMSYVNVTPAGPHIGIQVPGVPGILPGATFPGSQSSVQVVSPVALWIDPAVAAQSGIYLGSSSLVPLFNITGHAKNTTPLNNSDIDITVSAWQILHIVTSGDYLLRPGSWVYWDASLNWAAPGTGTWYYIVGTTTVSWFIPQSAFVATNRYITNTGGYGIEHVPEPVSILLLVGGVGAFATGRRRRRI